MSAHARFRSCLPTDRGARGSRPAAFFAVVLLLPILLALIGAAGAQAIAFSPKADFTTGYWPHSVAVGDFNGDGKADLVTANYGAHTLSVLLGTGSGTFAAKTDLDTGSQANASVAVGDFNGDAKQDVVSAKTDADAVGVLLGDGSGGFGTKTDFATGDGPWSVAVGDFNGDGKADLVTANFSANTVSVLLGNGTGGFAAKSDVATGTAPRSVAVGDFNGDSKQDLVVANNTANTVSVLLGNGSGGFAAKTDFATAGGPNCVAVGDFNGDDKKDLAVVDGSSWKVSVLLGNGSGGFGAKTDFLVGQAPRSVAVADVDGDGVQDLVTANNGTDDVSVLLGNGSGGFGAKTDFATGNGPECIAVGDFNLDGRPDLVTADWSDSAAAVLLNATPPTLAVSIPSASSSWPSGSTQRVAWTFTPAVSAGEFRVSLVSSGGTWYVNKQVLPTAGRTSYDTSVIAAVPAGSYKAAVYWRPAVGSGTWTVTAKSAAFAVTPINVTAPTATTVWPKDSTQYVSWNVNPAMASGEFRVSLISSGGSWYVNKQVPAVTGKTSYTTAVNTLVPAAAGYKAAVYWRATVGSGTWTATAKSPGFTIANLTITDPTASSSWPRNSSQTVAWTVTPGLTGGEFRVSLVSVSAVWYVNKVVAAVPAQTIYSTSIVAGVPAAAGYKAAVYWRPTAGSGSWILTKKSAGFTVTP